MKVEAAAMRCILPQIEQFSAFALERNSVDGLVHECKDKLRDSTCE